MASLALALFAALWSVGRIGLLPPSFKPRALEMAGASTRVLVDTRQSSVLDLGVNTYDFRSITNRSLLVGNIMASGPVRGYIARRAHVPAAVLQVTSPVTPDFPRPLASDGEKHNTDILKSPDESASASSPTRRCRWWTSTPRHRRPRPRSSWPTAPSTA